jgi:hypothetical protein
MTTSDTAGGGPLTEDHRRELALARERSASIRRLALVATFNGWVSAVLAALSLPFAFFSLSGLLMTVVLGIVAFNELRGRRLVLNLEPRGATLLGWNQAGFLAAIILYRIWSLYANLTAPSPFASDPQTQALLEESLGPLDGLEELARQIAIVLYGSVIMLSILFQGGNSLYYFSRRKHVAKFVAETPQWVLDVLRSG